MSKRRWFDWHSWAGVTAGLLMFVVCWSGTVATMANEIDWLLNPAIRVEPQAVRASWGEIAEAARRAYPEAALSYVNAPLYANFASEVLMDAGDGHTLRVYVDPYTARVQGHTTYFNVQRFFRSLHMALFDLGRLGVGYYVVGALSLFLLASLVTSLVFYRRWWRGFLTLKTTHGARVFWSDAHKLTGVWSLWFVLAIGATGAWYLYEYAHWRIDPAAMDGQFPWPALSETRRAEVGDQPPLAFDALIARAQAARPDIEIRSVVPDSDGLFYAEGQSAHWLVRDGANHIFLDPYDGRTVATQRASDLNLYWRWSDTSDPLHFGNFAGLPVKLIWCAFGLLLSALSLTGAYLHHQRILARGADRVAVGRGARAAAGIVTLAVLVASVDGAFVEIADYSLPHAGGGVWQMTPAAVWLFLAGWVASTLAVILIWMRKLGRP